jgi:hypothetical protein
MRSFANVTVAASNPDHSKRNDSVHSPLQLEAIQRFHANCKPIKVRAIEALRETHDPETISLAINQIDRAACVTTMVQCIVEDSNIDPLYIASTLNNALDATNLLIKYFAILIAELIENEDLTTDEKTKKFKRVLANPKNAKNIALLGYTQGGTTKTAIIKTQAKDEDQFDPTYFQIKDDTLMLSASGLEALKDLPINTNTYNGCTARHITSTSGFPDLMQERAAWEISLYRQYWTPIFS